MRRFKTDPDTQVLANDSGPALPKEMKVEGITHQILVRNAFELINSGAIKSGIKTWLKREKASNQLIEWVINKVTYETT